MRMPCTGRHKSNRYARMSTILAAVSGVGAEADAREKPRSPPRSRRRSRGRSGASMPSDGDRCPSVRRVAFQYRSVRGTRTTSPRTYRRWKRTQFIRAIPAGSAMKVRTIGSSRPIRTVMLPRRSNQRSAHSISAGLSSSRAARRSTRGRPRERPPRRRLPNRCCSPLRRRWPPGTGRTGEWTQGPRRTA